MPPKRKRVPEIEVPDVGPTPRRSTRANRGDEPLQELPAKRRKKEEDKEEPQVPLKDVLVRYALFTACERRDVDMVKALTLRHFSTKTVRSRHGGTPLHTAAGMGELAIVDHLLKAGFDPNSGYTFGQYPLHIALSAGHEDTALRLLEGGAKPGQCQDRWRYPLLIAVEQGMERVVQALANRKVDTEVKDRHGDTALLKAAQRNNTDIVRILIQAGARPDHRGWTPDLDAPHVDVFGDRPLFVATEHGNEEMVRLLVDTGRVNLNAQCGIYRNLDYAIYMGNMNIIRMLIDAGANPALTNGEGMNAAHHFARYGSYPRTAEDDATRQDIMDILVKHNVDISSPDTREGYTPLMYAVTRGNLSAARCLLEANCDTEVRSHRETDSEDSPGTGLTGLELAVERKKAEMVQLLLAAGSEVSVLRKKDLNVSSGDPVCIEIQRLVDEALQSVRSLKLLCRDFFKRRLKTPYKDKVIKLGLPDSLMNFLLLSDLIGSAPH